MEEMQSATIAKEISFYRRERMYGNLVRNDKMVECYQKLLVSGIVKKRMSPVEIRTLRERMKRLQNCNRFWSIETYETSHVKVLLRTFLCKDKFCNNCNQIKKLILQNRFLPYMEKYKDSLYHIVLTVPDCSGEELRATVQNMIRCFKTLITYLNGNKKVKGIDLMQYDFQGCIRSLEITYKGNIYHPHFHVAAVLGNGDIVENKHISNKFSSNGKRLFSEFESIIQRMWWILINSQRLTTDNILGNSNSLGRYSCTADKFQADDYKKLFGYMTKMYSEDSTPMTYDNFKTLYTALTRIRQLQGYGIFYNIKELDMESYTDHDYQALESYLSYEEQPVSTYEPFNHLVDTNGYTVLKIKRTRKI